MIRPRNPHVKVFKNQVASLPPRREYPDDGPVTLFFGALNREADWTAIIPALNRILADRGDSLRIQVVHDWGFYDAIETEFKSFESFCAYDKYITLLRTADISILPLNPTPFNLCKSDLKFIESAAHGTVTLASPTIYGDTIRPGETGLIFESPEDFEEKLIQLIDDRAMRLTIASNAYRYVAENRMLSQHYRERHAWYCEMLDRLPDLNRELRERVPEMG